MVERYEIETTGSSSYAYTQTGFDKIDKCDQKIELQKQTETATLTWTIDFRTKDNDALVNMTLFFADQTARSDKALKKFVLPTTYD